MTKSLRATCEAGVVTCEGKEVTGALVFSRGVAHSQGILYLDEGKAYYFPDATTDLVSALEEVINALNACSSGLSALANPVGVATAVASIALAVGSLGTLKDNLK